MSTHRDEYLELCAVYVIGDLTEDEAIRLDAHLKEGCRTCVAEIDRLSRGARVFASAWALRAPTALRARVLEAARAEPEVRKPVPVPRRRSAPNFGWIGAVAAVLIAALGVTEWRAASRLERELASARVEISRLHQEIQSERAWSAVATAPQTRVIELAPTPAGSPQLHARVTYDPATRRAVVVVSYFVTPAGKDYQLWAITKTGPESLGLVRADREGRALIRLEDAGDPATLAAFAVSLESGGGAPTPHAPAGPVVMVGKIGT